MENTNQPTPINTPTVEEDEIDLIALAKTLWTGKKTVIRAVIICAVLGLVIAFLSPKEYTSTTIMVPQLSQSSSKLSKLGGLSSLAAMAGFNLDMSSGESLSPMLYPQIVSSVPFQLELMNAPFSFSNINHPISIYEYYSEIKKPGILNSIVKYTIGLPGLIIKSINPKKEEIQSGTNLIALSKDQDRICKLLERQVTLDVNSKEGYLTLTANMPEAALSAEVAQYSRELLQKYITQIKVEKAQEQLDFIQDRYNEKKKEFENAQETLARFRDQNKNVATAMAQTEEDRLQSEYSIAFNVYSELAKQLEQAQIQVKEDTPVFSILSPAVVPNLKSKPKKAMILIIWIFLGGVIGSGIIFGKQYITTVKEKWEESNKL